jgi:hypothetical protein
MKTTATIIVVTGTIILLTIGCESSDDQLARLASESAAQQARQSEQVAEASANLTAAAKGLVESSGRSHEALVEVQRELRVEQSEIGRQRELLEEERKTLAAERRTSPVIAAAILQVSILIACLLPLLLGWYVLRLAASNTADPDVTEILLDDLTADPPRLLGPDRHVGSAEPTQRLPEPD